MLISCVLQCTDGLRLIKRLENYAYRMSEKTAYRSLEKSAYRSLKKLLTVHLQIHLTACNFVLFVPHGKPYNKSVQSRSVQTENAVKIEPAHRTSRATASESKSHPEIGWL